MVFFPSDCPKQGNRRRNNPHRQTDKRRHRHEERKKPGVMLYFELEPLLREMHPEDGYALILAILAYARCGTPPQFSSAALNYAWAFVRAGIDRDDARYSHVVEQRRKAAEKRWSKRTDASDEDTFAALACK